VYLSKTFKTERADLKSGKWLCSIFCGSISFDLLTCCFSLVIYNIYIHCNNIAWAQRWVSSTPVDLYLARSAEASQCSSSADFASSIHWHYPHTAQNVAQHISSCHGDLHLCAVVITVGLETMFSDDVQQFSSVQCTQWRERVHKQTLEKMLTMLQELVRSFYKLQQPHSARHVMALKRPSGQQSMLRYVRFKLHI